MYNRENDGKVTWSVETEGNSWDDDLFNGTYEECVEYCEKNDYAVDGVEARLAEILVDEDGCVLEVLDLVEEL